LFSLVDRSGAGIIINLFLLSLQPEKKQLLIIKNIKLLVDIFSLKKVYL